MDLGLNEMEAQPQQAFGCNGLLGRNSASIKLISEFEITSAEGEQ
jgi:hypothetical protein